MEERDAIEILKKMKPSKHIPAGIKTELRGMIKTIADKNLNNIIEKLLKCKSYTQPMQKEINDFIKKYYDTIDLDQSELIKNESTEITLITKTDEGLSKKLDAECDRYNKFTQSNPAEFIRYNKTKKNYVLVIDNKEIKSKNLEKLVLKLKEKIGHNLGKQLFKIVLLYTIQYKNKKIIIYLHENQPFFDINHIINCCDEITVKRKKYDEYKRYIELYIIENNVVGGFYIKELISQETFFKMLLHTQSIFSNKFKDDVAVILTKLSNNGNLIIKDDAIKLINNPITTNIERFKFNLPKKYVYDQTYTNIKLCEFLQKQIDDFDDNVNLMNYDKMNVLYICFIVDMIDPNGWNRLIIKIGYTGDIHKRREELKREYKSIIRLFGIKYIKNEQEELHFHKILKSMRPELCINIKINGIDKQELYVFDKKLYNIFLEYKSDDNQILNTSHNIINYKELEYQEKEHIHQLAMKDKEITMKDREIELMNIKFKIIEIELELKKMDETGLKNNIVFETDLKNTIVPKTDINHNIIIKSESNVSMSPISPIITFSKRKIKNKK
jgi:hypothetical protein